MKYIKTYEVNTWWKEQLEEALQKFYEDFEKVKDKVIYPNYILKDFKYEYKMLYFYYNDYNPSRYYKRNDYESVKKYEYIIKKIKEKARQSILDKIEKEPFLYLELKNVMDKKPLNKIHSAKVKYVMFTFNTALKNVPDYIKNSTKYNL